MYSIGSISENVEANDSPPLESISTADRYQAVGVEHSHSSLPSFSFRNFTGLTFGELGGRSSSSHDETEKKATLVQ